MTRASRQHWQPIRPPAHAPRSVSLAARYGTPLTGSKITGQVLTSIDAYTTDGAAQKHQFLSDARRYLRATGRALALLGFTEQQIHTNPGGMAVSGEVYAEFRHPAHASWVFCLIESVPYRFLTPIRGDGVLTTARWREQTGQSITDGDNQHLSAYLESSTLAQRLAQICGVVPLPAPAPACNPDTTTAPQVVLFRT